MTRRRKPNPQSVRYDVDALRESLRVATEAIRGLSDELENVKRSLDLVWDEVDEMKSGGKIEREAERLEEQLGIE